MLSPVTTITRMPAVIHESIAFLTSSLGGFSIPTYIRERRNPENKRLLLTRGKTRILEKQKRRKRAFKALPKRKLLKKKKNPILIPFKYNVLFSILIFYYSILFSEDIYIHTKERGMPCH